MVYTLGESLMDIVFDEDGKIESGAGGAMLNLSVTLGRCGTEVSLVSELGDDKVADKITSFLKDNYVNTSLINCYYKQPTSVALAFLDEKRVPTYIFHKSYPDKRQLKIPRSISSSDILVFGSIYSLDEKIRFQLKQLVDSAKLNNALIVYDPNIRNAHHLENKTQRKALIENIALADIIKGSDEDFMNIFGIEDDEMIIKEIRKINSQAIIFITKGDKGAMLICRENKFIADAVRTDVRSTIGAGDNFTAGIVYFLKKENINKQDLSIIDRIQLENMLRAGIGFSSEVCGSYDNYISKEFANSL
ncbi:MAG: carbohydrate kinase [Chlorobi bacterium]|nr:carbohydrate kinase [Chlorobiota bacterium]